MFWGISKTWDPKVHPTRKNVLGKIDDSGPFSQPLPGAFHDEAPFSGSFNVSMESKGKNLLPLPASSGYYGPVPPASSEYYASSGYYGPVPPPASSGYYGLVRPPAIPRYPAPPPALRRCYALRKRSEGQDVDGLVLPLALPRYHAPPLPRYHAPPPALPPPALPKRSEGQDVDVNQNISGAPRYDEAPSSSSSSGPTKSRSDLISSEPKDKVEDVNLDELQKLREKQVEEDLLSTGRQKVFNMEALKRATRDFHSANKVGAGTFGEVYKGTTDDGKQIAVKKLFFKDERSREFMKKQFENEKLLEEVRHRNLVDLLGYCEHGSEMFLVSEYLPNGSLDKFLSDANKRKELDWPIRNKIFLGIACGLRYLHEECPVHIIHRDIKASNILLDEKLNPKIADFGTANRFPEDMTHVIATSCIGTRGYLAPEYAMEGKISVKADVYSFGVVLLELLTGELILDNAIEYLEWVWSSYSRNKVADTIDRTITETWDKKKGKAQALRCFQVAFLCLQKDVELRPTMSRVITMLSSSESLPVPTKPWLVSSRKRSFLDYLLLR